MLRYWDGVAWTEHQAPGSTTGYVPTIKPGLAPVWITAVLSLFTFYFRTFGSDGGRTTISIPIGLVSMFICWYLVGQASRSARRLGIALPGAYSAARIVAGVLGAVAVLGSVLAMATGN
jgi:hypothetical protein